MFYVLPKCAFMSKTVATGLCPKRGLNLAKRQLFASVIQGTNIIVGLELLTTGTNVTTVLCAQGKKFEPIQAIRFAVGC